MVLDLRNGAGVKRADGAVQEGMCGALEVQAPHKYYLTKKDSSVFTVGTIEMGKVMMR